MWDFPVPGLPTSIPNWLAAPPVPQPSLQLMAVNTFPVCWSTTVGPCHWKSGMLEASKNWLATRLSAGTPASAPCQETPSSVQAMASPPGPDVEPPAPQPTQFQDRYTMGFLPSARY